MYSTNNSRSKKDYIYCRNDCGARITFSNNAISRNGRKIPLQENGLPHNCPKSPFNRGRQQPHVSIKFVREIENTIVPPEEVYELSILQQQNQRRLLIEQDKVNRLTPFDSQRQFYPADLFMLVGFDFKAQPIWERNPRWHDEDEFYIGRAE